MKRFRPIALAVGLFLCLFAQGAQASIAMRRCNDTAKVEMNPVFDKPHFVTGGDLKALQKLTRDPEKTIPQYDAVTLGLTSYEPFLFVNVPVTYKKFRDGSTCAEIGTVRVSHGYKNVTVFVASDFPKDSCAFKHIMEHELRHVAANEALLREFSFAAKYNVESFLRMHGTSYNASPQTMQHELQDRVRSIVQQSVLQMASANRERQKAIDTPAEYAKNKTACGGEIAEKVEVFRRKSRPWWQFW